MQVASFDRTQDPDLGSFRGTLTTQLYSSRTRNKAVVKLPTNDATLFLTWALTMQMLNDDLA